ncbi:MAG: hypothetical protein M1821_008305 [Bathelium mastoideum]|nr:MAG: hypothetical protein M1821_008305 [Bathelium mastoideum]
MASGKVRNYILTGSAVVVVMLGSFYGAGLKSQHQIEARKQVRYEETPDEQIARLEGTKAALMSRKLALESKIRDVQGRKRRGETFDQGKNG